MDIEEEVLQFIRDYDAEHGHPPSKNTIIDKIDGINNPNFYKKFGSISNAYERAGVSGSLGELDKMALVRKGKGKRARTIERLEVEKEAVQATKDVRPHVDTLMRILGEENENNAMKRATSIVSQYAKLAFMNDIKKPDDLNTFFMDQINEFRGIATEAVDSAKKYTDMDKRETLEWIGINEESFALMDYIAKKAGRSKGNYNEAGTINKIIERYFEGPPHFIRAIITPQNFVKMGHPPIRLSRLREDEIKALLDQFR